MGTEGKNKIMNLNRLLFANIEPHKIKVLLRACRCPQDLTQDQCKNSDLQSATGPTSDQTGRSQVNKKKKSLVTFEEVTGGSLA